MRLLVVLHVGSDRGCYRIMLGPVTGGSESPCAMPDLVNASCIRQDCSMKNPAADTLLFCIYRDGRRRAAY